MKRSEIHESRYLAGRLEINFQVIAAVAGSLGVFAMLTKGWPLGGCIFLLAVVVYGLAKLFALAAVLLDGMAHMIHEPGDSRGDRQP